MIDRKGPPPLGSDSPVLSLNGVPTRFGDGNAGGGFLQEPMGSWRPLADDGLYDVEAECVRLHDDLAASIFGSLAYYHSLLPQAPQFLSESGLNSESALTRDQFGQVLIQCAAQPELNRFLYLYDVRSLVAAVQECTKEVSQLTGEFYRILNLEPFFTPGVVVPDGVRWSTSPTVTTLNSTLGFLFIRMHSLLDYIAKLAREIDELRSDFKSYPRLASANFLFGHRKKLKIGALPDSLFEPCEDVTEVELVRNLLIHDGLLDDMPKAYEVIENGVAVERFILFPDRRDGKLERFKNRHRFYGGEDKINLRLAGLVKRFQQREIVTLAALRDQLIARRG
ncbi:hypothetical protein [Pelagerythrobacter aerophilus]